jgi:hypothetical protein
VHVCVEGRRGGGGGGLIRYCKRERGDRQVKEVG